MKFKGKSNATIKNSGFEVYTLFYVIDKLKTGSLLSKNTAENINAINFKNLENVDNINEEYKDIFEGIGKLKDFELTLHIDKPVSPVVRPSRKIPYNLRQKLLEKLIELEENYIIEKSKVLRPESPP